MSLKFGLNVKKSKPPPPKRNPLFGGAEPDEDDGSDGYGASKSAKPGKKPVPEFGNLSSSLAARKVAKQAEELDPSIYDYDAAYDAMHAGKSKKEAERRQEAVERKPRYMNALLESAKVREKDRLRAQDKLLQREREEEGDEFADKEKFVTSAYKQQQAEIRRAEEEERKREEEEAKKNAGKGMLGFYQNLMDKEDERHRAAMEAAKNIDPFKVKREDSDAPKEKSQADIARELKEQGRDVIINEDGEVADKRQLLSAGLNVAPKPKPATAATSASSRTDRQQALSQKPGFDKKAQRERQSRMVEAQLEQAAKRTADDEAEEQRKKEHQAKNRKTASDITSARERYLQRKKEAAEAKARGEET